LDGHFDGIRWSRFPDSGEPQGGDFIHALPVLGAPVDDPGGLPAKHGENAGKGGTDLRVEDPDELVFRSGGIEQRAEQVENRAPALLTELFANRGHRLEGGMIEWGEKETGADL